VLILTFLFFRLQIPLKIFILLAFAAPPNDKFRASRAEWWMIILKKKLLILLSAPEDCFYALWRCVFIYSPCARAFSLQLVSSSSFHKSVYSRRCLIFSLWRSLRATFWKEFLMKIIFSPGKFYWKIILLRYLCSAYFEIYAS